MRSLLHGACIASCLIVTTPSFGQGAPITGSASVAFQPEAVVLVPNTEFGVDVRIDVTGLNGTFCGAGVTPVVLGGYQIAMEFDTTRLEYLGVGNSPTAAQGNAFCPVNAGSGGSRPPEYSLPVATDAAANITATALFITTNGVSPTGPTGGPFCYFRILMRVRPSVVGTVTNANSLRFRNNARGTYQLVTTPYNCGPADIPKSPDVSVSLVTYPVELTRFSAE